MMTRNWQLSTGNFSIRFSLLEYHVTILEPLVYKRSCAYEYRIHVPASGVKKIERENKATVIIDFGDGDCDRVFTTEIVK
jgi:hypothetical protein